MTFFVMSKVRNDMNFLIRRRQELEDAKIVILDIKKNYLCIRMKNSN